jgi:hypothetical protein
MRVKDEIRIANWCLEGSGTGWAALGNAVIG